MSQDRDLEKAVEESASPQNDLARILGNLERSVHLLGKAVRSSLDGASGESLLTHDGGPNADDFTVADAGLQRQRACPQRGFLHPQETLEEWWTSMPCQLTRSHLLTRLTETSMGIVDPRDDLHPWKAPDLSKISARGRSNRVFYEFEKWLMSYGRTVLQNPTPFTSLVLYRLEADALQLTREEVNKNGNIARLEAEADEKLELVNIIVAALQLACRHPDDDIGLWNISLGAILERCHLREVLPRPAVFDESHLRQQFTRIVDALTLLNIQNASGSSLPPQTVGEPHLLTMGELFEPSSLLSTATTRSPSEGQAPDTFTTANLCLVNLMGFGGIKVAWTEHLSEHLYFHVEKNLLSVYWFGGTARAKWLKGSATILSPYHIPC